MPLVRTHPGLRSVLIVTMIAIFCSLAIAPPVAGAHAELRQASPAVGSTVGGPVHAIALQFFGLNETAPQIAQVFDAAGDELASQLNQEGERLVIALVDPITTPGTYVVTYSVNGIDGDFTQDSFSFDWAEGAPEPAGITVDVTSPTGFDTLNFVLLVIAAIVAAFLVQRFLSAWKDHRAAQAASTR